MSQKRVSQATDRRAFAMGIFFTIYFAMLLAGPPVAGAIVDLTSDPAMALILAAALFFVVMPLSIAFSTVRRRATA